MPTTVSLGIKFLIKPISGGFDAQKQPNPQTVLAMHALRIGYRLGVRIYGKRRRYFDVDCIHAFAWLQFKSCRWYKYAHYDLCCSCRSDQPYNNGRRYKSSAYERVVATCLFGAVVAARFANKCDIKKLNRIIGLVLLVLGIATIFTKLFS